MTALNSSDFTKSSWVNQSFSAHRLPYLGLIQKLYTRPSFCFSEIDQAFIVWGVLTLSIFSLGQFSPISWTAQAVLDAALTGAGIATTSGLTWAIATQAKLRWVIFLWAVLMTIGIVVTAWGLFYSSALILSNLCFLWLGLCAAGYGAMAIGMKSRCFTAACLVHFVAIASLSYSSSYQFLISGLVMAFTLFFFSVVPWDRA